MKRKYIFISLFVFFILLSFGIKSFSENEKITSSDTSKIKNGDKISYNNEISNNSIIETYYSPNSKILAYVKEINGKYVLIINGKSSKKYNKISNFSFSKDSKNYAFLGETTYKNVLVKNGVEVELYDNILGYAFSDDSKSFSFLIKNNNGKQSIIKDSEKLNEYDNIYWLFYLKNSHDLTYEAEKNGKVAIVKNKEEGKFYDQINLGENYYLALEKGKYGIDDKKIIVKDGKEIIQYEHSYDDVIGIQSISQLNSPDFKSFTYKKGILGKDFYKELEKLKNIGGEGYQMSDYVQLIEKYQKYSVVKNGVEGKKYDEIYNLMFSQNSKNFAYVAKKDGKYFVVKNGIEGKKYDEIKQIEDFDKTSIIMSFSPDSKSLSYVAEKNGKYILVNDSTESKEYDNIYGFKYSPNSKNIILVTQNNGKDLLLKDNEEIKTYDNDIINKFKFGEFDYIKNYLLFLYESNDFIYTIIKNGKFIIVKNGIESQEYDKVENLILSPDSKNFAFIAQKDGKYLVIKDFKESKLYDNEIKNLQFSPNSKSFSFETIQNNNNFIVKDFKEFEGRLFKYSPDGKTYSYVK